MITLKLNYYVYKLIKLCTNTLLQVGRSLGSSILDLTGNNPFSRLPNSEFRTLSGLREWLRTMSTEVAIENRPKMKARCSSGGLHSQVGLSVDTSDDNDDGLTTLSDDIPVTIKTCVIC